MRESKTKFHRNTKNAVEIALTIPLEISSTLNSSKFFRQIGIKKSGFTLSETLITLVIIGVIAAITVPTLLSKYQKQTYVVSLKKTYSLLTQAVHMIPITAGCPSGDYECAGFAINAGYDTDLTKDAELLANQFKKASAITNESMTGHNNRRWITDDGVLFEYGPTGHIKVDINGEKGPNLWGRDRFSFDIATTNIDTIKVGTVIPSGSKLSAIYTNQPQQYWNYDNNAGGCNSSTPNKFDPYIGCTGRVLEERAMNY